MPDVNSPFAIPLTAEDRYSKVFDAFKKKAKDTLGEVKHSVGEVSEAGKKLGESFEPFARLMGGGGSAAVLGGLGLAGAIEQLNEFTRAGAEMGRTSARIGVGTRAIQEIGQAAYLTGGRAETGARALETLGQKLHDAAWGRDAQAIAVFKEFNIAVRDGTGHIRTADQVLPELADKIAGLKDPYQQSALAAAAFGDAGRDMLPWLRKGRQGIEEYRAEVRKYGAAITDDGIAKADEFEKAQRRVEFSLTGVRNTLAEEWLPALTRGADKTAEWINELRNSPQAMDAAEKGAAVLATAVGVTLVGAIAKVGTAIVAANAKAMATPLGRVLLLGYLGYKDFVEQKSEKDVQRHEQDPTRYLDPRYWLGVGPYKHAPKPAAEAAIPPAGVGAGGPVGDTIQRGISFFEKKGLSHDQAAGVVARLAAESGGGKRLDPNAVNSSSGAYGIAQWLGGRKPAALATKGDLDQQLELVWREFQTSEGAAFQRITAAGSAADTARAMESYERAGNPAFTEMAARTAAQMAGAKPSGADIATPASAPSAPPPGGDEEAMRQAYWRYNREHPDAMLDWSEYLRRRPGGNGPNWLPQTASAAGGGDSKHHFQLDISGAPPGTRGNLISASGPATFGLNVGQAMRSP